MHSSITFAILCFTLFAQSALATSEVCHEVRSQSHDWTVINFDFPVNRITAIQGQWTAHKDNGWGYSGPKGNSNQLCTDNSCTVPNQPYLRLYMRNQGRIFPVEQPQNIAETTEVQLVGNDFPEGRQYNHGSLRVCFSGSSSSVADEDIASAAETIASQSIDPDLLAELEELADFELPPLDQLDPDNLPPPLNDYPEIAEKIRQYKNSIAQENALAEEAELLKSNLKESMDILADEFAAESQDIELTDLLAEFDDELEWEPEPIKEDGFDPEDNYYQLKAQETIDILQTLLVHNNRIEFIKTALVWRAQQAELLPLMQHRASYAPREWDAYASSHLMIETFLYSHLTEDYWFKDSPIPEESRVLIDGLSTHGGPVGFEIANEIKTWQTLNDQQKAVVETILLLGAAVSSAAQSAYAGVVELQGLINQAASAVRNGVKCITVATSSGDFGDLYEVASGKDICTGEELTIAGRAISGAGLFLGSGALWRGIANIVGLRSVIKKVVKSIDGIQNTAIKHKIVFLKADAKRLKSNPLTNTNYTEKVKLQMQKDKFHGFPVEVDNFAGLGKKTTIAGGDGIKRTKIEVEGEYLGRKGYFEWIIEPGGLINHRKFEPYR